VTVGQIKNRDDYDQMEAEESNFINSKNKFGKNKLEEVKDTELNRAELLEKQK